MTDSLQEEPNLSSSASIKEQKKNLIIALEETLMQSLLHFSHTLHFICPTSA